MKLPSTLKVGAFTVRVKQRPGLEMDRNGVYGRYQAVASLIELRTDLGDDHTRDIILHEALHAVLYVHGIKDMIGMDDEFEERLLTGLAPALLSLLRDNPALVTALTA